MGRESICFCNNCARRFREKAGTELPRKADWDDQAYRAWITWNYARRVEVWEMNNKVTRAAGGPDCIWSGMNSGSVTAQARSFRDLKEICIAPTSSCWTTSGETTTPDSSRTAIQESVFTS
jgi:hypothetical protein